MYKMLEPGNAMQVLPMQHKHRHKYNLYRVPSTMWIKSTDADNEDLLTVNTELQQHRHHMLRSV